MATLYAVRSSRIEQLCSQCRGFEVRLLLDIRLGANFETKRHWNQ